MVERFRVALRTSPRGYAPDTVRKYVALVERWVEHVDGDVAGAGVDDVEQWLVELDRGRSGTRDACAALRRFYRWAVRAGVAGHDPTATVELPRMFPRVPRPMTPGDVQLAVLTSDGPTRAMLVLMAGCGLRCVEVSRLRWCDVDLAAGRVIVHGKGGRERVLHLSQNVRRVLASIDSPGEYVFESPATGGAYTAARVSQLVNGHLRAVGIRATAHQLRHYFATEALRVSGDLAVVRDLLGHSSVITTEGYAQLVPGRSSSTARAVPVPGL